MDNGTLMFEILVENPLEEESFGKLRRKNSE